ncbi:MAG: DedA family protein [Neisseriaceae bacterium]
MLEYLEVFFSSYGYLAVFAVLILCGVGLPIPEDITLIAGGIISGLGEASLSLMILVGMLGVLLGDLVMFALGKTFGHKLLDARWLRRVITAETYRELQEKFSWYGSWAVFLFRFVPGLRAPMFLTAGLSQKISYVKFIMLDGMAALISVPLWVWAGHYFAKNKAQLLQLASRFKLVTFLLILVIVAVFLAVRFYRRKKIK